VETVEQVTLTDTHCHLDLPNFDGDRAEVLLRAEQAGVTRILIPGLHYRSSQSVIHLAAGDARLHAAIGIHPTEACGAGPSTMRELRSLGNHPKVKAIGEIGLDYHWDSAPHSQQQAVLIEQLSLAADLKLPVVIHFREKGDASCGDCASDLLEILQEWTGNLNRDKNPLAEKPGVLHSFSGSLEMARAAINLGFYLGVAGPLTYKNARERQELVAAIPLNAILIETDAPFQSPHPHRGKRNEPAYVRLIADKIALVHSCTTGKVAKVTTENAQRLFRWE
jgi:TatD DNase family protein